MKYFLLLLILFSGQLFAKGYYCSALCISVDSYHQYVNIIGEFEIEVGSETSREAHRLLKKKCRLATYDQSSILVDNLRFRSTYNHSCGSYDYYGEYFQTDGWNVLEGYEMGGSYSSGTQRTLDISIRGSQASIACDQEHSIETGYTPYVGNLPIL